MSKYAPSAQLLLTLHAHTVKIPEEVERRVVSALAELLLAAAVDGAKPAEGGSDEREDP